MALPTQQGDHCSSTINATRGALLLLRKLIPARLMFTENIPAPPGVLLQSKLSKRHRGVSATNRADPCSHTCSKLSISVPPAHLPRLLRQATHDGVAVWPAGGAVILVLHNHCLLSSIAAGEEHDNLVGLCITHRNFSHSAHPALPSISQRCCRIRCAPLHLCSRTLQHFGKRSRQDIPGGARLQRGRLHSLSYSTQHLHGSLSALRGALCLAMQPLFSPYIRPLSLSQAARARRVNCC